ncbi:MAG: AAA family ATPase [Eubacteriales bacterium]|nr:AAA family ATPase [Eubacteriales bacterium]
MAKTVAIGKQDFEKIISGNYFYIDKTHFIREWWDSGDDVK